MIQIKNPKKGFMDGYKTYDPTKEGYGHASQWHALFDTIMNGDAGAVLWLTNVLIFGIWYWEIDRGGPAHRLVHSNRTEPPDFLFPQMSQPGLAPGWRPGFVDYLYTSYTNATAFSPTDTLPLSALAKLLMAIQSLIALITTLLVIARAVNVLG